ncbi:hypothetical protein C8Q79DRAFT_287183 [Trametes meyenii]|nr:hypothetical protein C8Q79DRAFT_287183 [Trametes meyenii]
MAHKAVRLELPEFIEDFFSSPLASASEPGVLTPPRLDRNIFAAVEGAKNMTEAEISQHFIAALNTYAFAPNLKLSVSQHMPDKGDITGQKIDAAFFRPERLPIDGRPHWSDQLVAVEFKPHDTKRDPFDDRDDKKVESDAAERKRVRGQIIEYAEHIFRYQHRTALFMLLVIGRRFRLLRWDRSGTLVTKAVDYFENPDSLCEVLWRMSRLSDEQLGCDPSAARLLPGHPHYRRMTEASLPSRYDIDHTERRLDENEVPKDGHVFRYVRDMFRDSLRENWPRYRLEIREGGIIRNFLVCKPVFHASGMAGRGTRGYVALDYERDRFVWLKDAWRAYYELVDQEGSVLSRLNQESVDNVPTLVCHGDILNQTTMTPTYWERKNPPSPSTSPGPGPSLIPLALPPPAASSSRTLAEQQSVPSKGTKRCLWEVDDGTDETLPLPSNVDSKLPKAREDCPLRRHMHYRLVVEEVAMPLTKFQNGRQLVSIILDCVVAHQDAFKAGIVHRDVSGGNILIYPKVAYDIDTNEAGMNWSGLLADWELSKPVVEKGGLHRARQPERTGTWQYMSVAVLSKHSRIVQISDELESFFHVTLYYAVRYLRSNCRDVGAFIEAFFDSYNVTQDNKYECGTKKLQVMKGVTKLTKGHNEGVLQFDSTPLNDFFASTLIWFNAHYAVHDYEEQSKQPQSQPALAAPSKPPSQSTRPIVKKYSALRFAALPPQVVKTKMEPPVRKPSPEQEQDALKVAVHDHMLSALMEIQGADGWQEDRVEGDNVPPEFKPRWRVGPPVGASVSTVKKRRVDSNPQTWGPTYPFRVVDYDSMPRTPPRGKTIC